MLSRILESISHRTVLILIISTLMVACATEEALHTDQPIEPSFQEKVTDCSKIGDRGERDRCLYGG
jgi:hypothetical protein